MRGPPEDPMLQELWSELAKSGYDPEDMLDAARRNAVHGGLHAEQLPEIVDSLCDAFEDWEHIWLYAGPTDQSHHYQYELAHFIVEWSDAHGGWVPETEQTGLFEQYEDRLSDDLLTVPADQSRETEESPLGRTITDIDRDQAPSFIGEFTTHAEAAPVEVRFRLRPDNVGSSYEFSYEFIQQTEDGWESVVGNG